MAVARRSGGPRVFHGWWVVLACAVGLFFSFSPIVTFTFGIFLRSLNAEFGWTRSQISLAYSLGMLAFALAQPITGRVIDRLGARPVIVPCVATLGAGIAALSLAGPAPAYLYGVYLLIGAAGSGTASMAYFSVLTRWFDRRRGLAIGLALAGNGLSAFIMPSVAQALVTAVGWRAAYAVIGLLVIAFTLPIVALLLVPSPECLGLQPDGDENGRPRAGAAAPTSGALTARQALRTAAFWMIVLAFALNSASVVGCLTHLVPLLTDRGVTPARAALAASTLGGATLLGRVGVGYLVDRLFAPYVAIALLATGATGIFMLWMGVTGALAFVAAFMLGAAGAVDGILPFLITRYFGLAEFGQVYGPAVAINVGGWVSGPFAMGLAFDLAGSYRPMLTGFLVAIATAIVFLAVLSSRHGPHNSVHV
jgi:predicted MFS family arabinose efflux permease